MTDTLVPALLAAWRGGPAADDRALAAALATPDDAYAAQEALVAALDGAGAGPSVHWKSGGPSREAPLTHAPLPAGGVRPSGGTLDGVHLRHRWIEAEIALRLGRAVGPQEAAALDAAGAVALVEAMAV